MKVLFLHGLESKPGGAKANVLKEVGYEVLNPALPKESFEDSVKIAQDIVGAHAPEYIVGSSRGGAVAMEIDPGNAKLVLIAPAWKRFGVDPVVSSSTVILHSKNDNIIPIEDSEKLAELNNATIEVCGTCHRMSDAEALDVLKFYTGR